MLEEHHVPLSHLVHDEITEDWVIVAPGRNARPHLETATAPACRFCPKALAEEEILAETGRDERKLTAIRNRFPTLDPDGEVYGRQELLVEGTTHEALADWKLADLARLMDFHATRMTEAAEDPRIRFVLLFKNHGHDAGATQVHPHSQLWAMELVPPRLALERGKRMALAAHLKTCPDCLAVSREMHGPRVVFEDARAIAFTHPTGRFGYEVRILAKRHADHLGALASDERASFAKALEACLPLLAEREAPFNFYTQDVLNDPDQHCELRLMPRLNIWAGLELSAGIYVNPVEPVEAAKAYREAAKGRR